MGRIVTSGTHLSSQSFLHHHNKKIEGRKFLALALLLALLLVYAQAGYASLTIEQGFSDNSLRLKVDLNEPYVLTVHDGSQESSYYAQEPQSLYYTLTKQGNHTFELFKIVNDELMSVQKSWYYYGTIQAIENRTIVEQTSELTLERIVTEDILFEEKSVEIIDSKGQSFGYTMSVRNKTSGDIVRNIRSTEKQILGSRESVLEVSSLQYEQTPVSSGIPYLIDLEFNSGPVSKIEFIDILLSEEFSLGIDEVDVNTITDITLNPLRAYAIDPERLDFANGIVTSVAEGHMLWKCADWNFNSSVCEGQWVPVKKIIPGEEYSFVITPNDPGYMETGLSIINTNYDRYYQNEPVQMIIAVLDNEGYLLSGAEISVKITSPANTTYSFGTEDNGVNELRTGIYSGTFLNTNETGIYSIDINTTSGNFSTSFSSWFEVNNNIEFRVLRQVPSAVDPWQGSFYSAYKITSRSISLFNFTELVPLEANITSGNYDEITETEEGYEVKWYNLTNESIVNLYIQPPLSSPDIMILGTWKINQDTGFYFEARPWFVALDPVAYYDPTRDIATAWSTGTGITFAEIDDSTRQPTVPNTADYLRSVANSGQVSTFGFNNITQFGIQSMTLWVYTGTGSNAQYTFSLLQGATSRCATTVAANSASLWRSCSWTTPSGDYSDMRINLGAPTRSGGGALQAAFVYAAYIEISYDEPPIVTLNNPANLAQVNNAPILFNFTVIDDVDSILPSCSLYGNFSGSWALNQTFTNVLNGTWRNFSVSTLSEGPYLWNVQCTDSNSNSAFSSTNRTININLVPPSITQIAFNETSILQGRQVRLNASITDYYGISSAIATLLLPNGTQRNYTLTPNGNEYFVIISDTTVGGTYNLTRIFANDTLGQVANVYPTNFFQVNVVAPETFDLFTPFNNTITSNLVPNLTWTQTNTHSFGNYTIQLDKDSSFGSPDYTYFRTSITQTWYQVDFALDTNSVYYWRVIAYDSFGNSRISNSTFIYITDTTNPTVTLNSPANNDYSITSLTKFNYTPSDTNGLASCTLYGNFSGSWQLNSTSSSIINNAINTLTSTIPEGRWLWNARCLDTAGNSGSATSNRTVIVDLSGPLVTLTNPANNTLQSNTNTIRFNASAQDAFSDLNECSLLINGSLDQTKSGLTNGVGFFFDTFLLNGNYSWQVNCTDIHGFEGISDSRNIEVEVIDNNPPFIVLDYPLNNSIISETNVEFLYTPQDATGILSCSLYVNNVINQTDSSVTNLVQNSFLVNGLSEAAYSWYVSCIDSAPEQNVGNSSLFYFSIDVNPPVVTLNSPLNNTISNISPTMFNATGTDLNLDYCELYTNRTGAFISESTNNTVFSGSPVLFSLSLNNEAIIWNVLCYDEAASSSFATNNRTYIHDSIAPAFSGIINNPDSPANYIGSERHFFNITWSDLRGISAVLFEHNFTGTFANYTPTNLGGGTYSFNVSSLAVGNYGFRWHANDTVGNRNSTNIIEYTVLRNESSVVVLLNSSQNNLTVVEGATVNITGSLLNPNSGLIELRVNGSLINFGSSPLSNINIYSQPGYYNVTAIYNETQNYSSSYSTLFLTVQDVTAPNITLLSPSDNGLIASGNVLLQFNVSDKSDIVNCSLYIDSIFDQFSTDIEIDTTEAFSANLGVGNYEWYVTCFDEWNNFGTSDTFNFSTIDTDEIVVTINSELAEYEIGETAKINVTTTDVFTNPLTTSIKSSLISGTTAVPWWNSSWKQRRALQIDEITGNPITAYVEMNITGLSGINSCVNHLRIIDQNLAISSVLPYLYISGNDNSWCFVGFEVNLSANELATNRIFAYYNTTVPSNPGYSLNFNLSQNYFASVAAADEGTPTNVVNIVGSSDATAATMSQGGGAGTHSAHGRGFITGLAVGTVLDVQARFRYAVPSTCATCTWELRSSVNDGASYLNELSGASTSGIATTSWYTLTSGYANLDWSEINRTRLQGRLVKTGGGGTGTLNLYWVEINVTYRKAPDTNSVLTGGEQILFSSSTDETDSEGIKSLEFFTSSLSVGTYSVVSVASADTFSDSTGFTTFEVVPDITPPNVTLISPDDFAEFGVGSLNLTYNITDLNPDSCNLYFGSGSTAWAPNESMNTPSNGQYTFQNIYFGLGIWEWNVYCTDSEGNTGYASQNYTLNITGPDLTYGTPAIWFSEEEKIEGNEITVYANITNIGLSNSDEPFNISFYVGDPDVSAIELGNQTVNSLIIGDTIIVSETFILGSGVNNIFVYIDRSDFINESDESNNKANLSLAVEIYHYYYGNITTEILLSNAVNQSVLDYMNVTGLLGHIVATSSDAVFSFSDLYAIGRNTQQNPVNNDFSDIDVVLGSTNAPDNVNQVWANGTDVPLDTLTFIVANTTIINVPIVNSTISNAFITGILWDSADDTGNLQYDTTDSEDLVFISRINPAQTGAYGTYDYEIKVPASLRGNDNKISFYVELE